MITLQCAVCGKNQKIKELYPKNFNLKGVNAKTFSARRDPDRIHYRFVVCENCGLIFSNPILPEKEINKFYKNSEFDYSLEASYLKKTYGHYLKKVLPKLSIIRLLDIGCGNGFFLEEANGMGVKYVFGIEPGIETVGKAPKWLQKKIKVGFFTNRSYKKDMFDIVTCFHTLDHMVNPNVFLKNVYSVLKPEGKALFIVHNTCGLSVKLFREKSPIFDIEHIYLFNKYNLALLFRKNKFKVIETFDVKNRYPLVYWSRMTPLPKPLKTILLNILSHTNTENIPVALKAGNIGIVVQKI